ncbi:hypothetical protein [Methylobacterium sp. Leaf361]|uniref:hypothetical protein n=1 Tax=Methylobacterium sp. Leaf361 TaxID=1736352 RepID=UPI000B1746AD|nr:hypothetical protein [Methylobacterium sp. Leaf361]
MDLRVIKIFNHGNNATEHVMLRADADIPDLSKYGICDSTYVHDDKPSNKERHFFWFPPKKILLGEYVVLNTRRGTYERYADKANDRILHRIFWGLNTTIWNKAGDKAVLFHFSAAVATNTR